MVGRNINTKQTFAVITPEIEHLYQTDSRWGNIILGRNRTIGKAGCAVTSLAMLCNYVMRDSDYYCNPYYLDLYFDSFKNSTEYGYSGDLVIWRTILRYLSSYGYDYEDIVDIRQTKEKGLYSYIKNNIDKGNPVIGGVKYRTYGYTQDHWILINGYHSELELYPMLDPASKNGNFYINSSSDNVVGETTRSGGYYLNRILYLKEKLI